jgi:hypothetical protein
MKTQEARAKLVTAALTLTNNTVIAPCSYELMLLEQYVQGVVSIEEVVALLEEHKLLGGEETSGSPDEG